MDGLFAEECSSYHLTGWPRVAIVVFAGLLVAFCLLLLVNELARSWEQRRKQRP
jgi:hypothetical protein